MERSINVCRFKRQCRVNLKTSELSDMFEKSQELKEEIRKKSGAIGYEI